MGSVSFELLEESRDGSWPAPVGSTGTVDRDARLTLHFRRPEIAGQAQASPEWRMIQSWLEGMASLTEQVAALNRRAVDLADEGAVAQVQAEINSLTDKVDATVERAEAMLAEVGLSEAEIQAVVLGTFDGRRGTSLQSIGRWMRQRQAELVAAAEALGQKGERQVVVMAFRRVGGRPVGRLPVENYDTITSGADIPVERSFLGLSPGDMRRFNMELEQSRRAVDLLRSLRDRVGRLGEVQAAMLGQIRSALDDLDRIFAARTFEETLGTAAGALRDRAKAEEVDSAGAARLSAMAADLEAIAGIPGQARAFISRFRSLLDVPDDAQLFGLMAGPEGLLARTDALLEDLAHLRTALSSSGTRLVRLQDSAVGVLSAADWQALLPVDVRHSVQALDQEVQPILERIAAVASVFRSSGPTGLVLDEIAADDSRVIARDLDDLVDGRILLADRVDAGDSVLVRIEIREKAAAGQPSRTLQTAEYDLKVDELGARPKLKGVPMLARGSSGPGSAQGWKPNVAALYSWHYRERHPSAIGRIWNWLDPALGIHAASLDQGPDNVEFGLGVQLSFWDSLLFLGAGYNLNVGQDEIYWLVGSDLFRLLGEIGGGP